MTRKLRGAQEGVVLLEALIGLLIFSLGVLALVAMQSVSVSNVSNAKYRVEASLLADEIINEIWLNRGTTLNNVNAHAFPGGSAAATATWVAKVRDPVTGLPGANAMLPSVVVRDAGDLTNPAKEITVTVNWKAPEALTPSSYVAIGYVSDP